MRDRDAQGFLTSLIRITPKMQVFQFSPRDNQVLNWFIATDPNAHLFVVTGAWVLPLLQSGMPFDDVRRMAARLQRAELEQLEVLKSVWVRARLQLHDLSDFLARPQAILNEAVQQLEPQVPDLNDLPRMRDMSGLEELLRRLRNSGLPPRLTGDDLLLSTLPDTQRTAAE